MKCALMLGAGRSATQMGSNELTGGLPKILQKIEIRHPWIDWVALHDCCTSGGSTDLVMVNL